MIVSRRQLNRTYLRRQHLLHRDESPVDEVVGQLVAVQAQEVDAPYVGLWARIDGFRHEHLTDALVDRRLVRGGLLRGTQHVTTAADYRWLRPLIKERMGRTGLSPFAKQTAGLDLADIAAAAREILAGQVLTRPALAKRLGERFPGRDAMALAWTAQHQLSLLHPPPSGTWRRRGHVSCTLAEEWLGQPLEDRPTLRPLLWRYLAACGPATVTDLQIFSGLRKLRDEIEALRPELTVHHDEQGRELFDRPDLSLADEDEPAPVRFLPEFDNLVLSHDDRTRIVSDDDRARVCPGLSVVRPTFLVDGFVAGTWSARSDGVHVAPFRPLAAADADAVWSEAKRLLAFLDLGDGAVVTVG